MDVAQNSVRAEASLVFITVEESDKSDFLKITIKDNGCGMTEEQVKQVIDPFFTTRTTRKVGLGVPLFKMSAEQTGGSFDIQSKLGEGTVTTAGYVKSGYDSARGHKFHNFHSYKVQPGHRLCLYKEHRLGLVYA